LKFAAAFDYQFEAIDEGSNNKLSKEYKNLLFVSINFICSSGLGSYQCSSVDVFLDRSDAVIASEAFWGNVPQWLVTLMQHAPTKRLQRFQNYMKTAREVAQTLVDRQMASHVTGKDGAKDVMSILSKIFLWVQFQHIYSPFHQLERIYPRIPRAGSKMRKY